MLTGTGTGTGLINTGTVWQNTATFLDMSSMSVPGTGTYFVKCKFLLYHFFMSTPRAYAQILDSVMIKQLMHFVKKRRTVVITSSVNETNVLLNLDLSMT
jgi:hypothetical protein